MDLTYLEERKKKYSFNNRLNSDFPSQIIVDLTERCNLACVHCPHAHFTKSHEYSGKNLDIDLHNKMVEEVRVHGKGITQYIRYTSNGEPFLHPHIFELLSYSVQNSGVFITVTTNGTLLKPEIINPLLDLDIHMIDISIDAFKPETYAKIRVNGSYGVTKNNVLTLLAARKRLQSRTKIVVSFVEQPDNCNEVEDFIEFWNNAGVDSVVIRRLHSSAGEITQIADSINKGSEDLLRYPCLYPWERITLNPRGELCYCPQDWSHGSVICSYNENTIVDIWQGSFYDQLRNAHLTNDFSKFEFCRKCPDWQQTRWPDEGRSYSDLVEDFIQIHRNQPEKL